MGVFQVNMGGSDGILQTPLADIPTNAVSERPARIDGRSEQIRQITISSQHIVHTTQVIDKTKCRIVKLVQPTETKDVYVKY